VSVITISDSEDEAPTKPSVAVVEQAVGVNQAGGSVRHKGPVYCVTVGDSDEEHRSPTQPTVYSSRPVSAGVKAAVVYCPSPVPQLKPQPAPALAPAPVLAAPQVKHEIKHEPHPHSSSYSGQKKRLLAKVQQECVTKQEPGSEVYQCQAGCKEPYHYDQHIVYTTSGDKAYTHKRGGGEVVVRTGYHLVHPHPPTAHSSRDHVISKAWSSQALPVHQGYSSHLSPQPLSGSRLSPLAGQPLYHQSELYRRQAVYVTSTQPTYLPPTHQVPAFTTGRALPPPAHHTSARPLLATHSHPLPAHMQPAHYMPLGYISPAKSHQYQAPLWFTE